MNPQERSQRAKRLALALGFDGVGITDTTPLSGFQRYQSWISRGFHGTMGYLERGADLRADVRYLAPFARSVIVVLQVYRPGEPFELADGQAGAGVARYARGTDYHLTIIRRLEHFVESLRGELGERFQAKCYTDTGALLERELAMRAGLGWLGKSTMLISPTLGTYTLIGVVLTSLEMVPDSPFDTEHCGTCRACIDACPTGAILDGRVVDARSCISYWTIENRGKVPEKYRWLRTKWWFGCDICQEVCPWNRRAPATIATDFAPRRVLREKSPADLLRMGESEYREAFRKSPIRRAKYTGFRLNLTRVLPEDGSSRAKETPRRQPLQSQREAISAESTSRKSSGGSGGNGF